MKDKNMWNNPEVKELGIEATEYEVLDGVVPDDYTQNCDPLYHS